MSKIKDFLKNNKRILIAAIAALVIVLLFSGFYNLIFYRASIRMQNETQLSKVNAQYAELSGKYAQVEEAAEDINAKDALILSKLLALEPEDVYDAAYLTDCAALMQNANGIVILDEKRQAVNQAGEIRNINYTEPYYDELFEATEIQAIALQDEGSESLSSICARAGSFFVIVQRNGTVALTPENIEETLWKIALHSSGLHRSSYFAAVETGGGNVIYSDYDGFAGKKLSAEKKSFGYYEIDGHDYYIQSCSEREGVTLLALTPREQIIQRCSINFKLAASLLIAELLILVAYMICLKQDETNPEQEYRLLGRYFLKNQTRRYKSLTIIVLVVLTAVFLIISSLNNNGPTMEYLKRKTNDCRETSQAYSEMYEKNSAAKDTAMYRYARIAGQFLLQHSDYTSKAGMEKLSDALGAEYMTIFSANGSTLCTSSPMDHINIMNDTESSLYELRYVLMGKEGVTVKGDPRLISENEYVYAVPKRGSDGVADGVIALTTLGNMSNAAYQAFEEAADTVFQAKTSQEFLFIADQNGKIIATDQTDGTVDISEFARTSLKDGYLGSLKIGETRYLASVAYLEAYDGYLYAVLPADQFSGDTLPNYIALFLMLILMDLWICYDGLGSRKRFEMHRHAARNFDERKQANLPWEELGVGEKMRKILRVYIHSFGVFLIVVKLLQSGEISSTDSAAYIVSGQWEKTFSGYSVLGNICIIFMFYTVIGFIQFLIKRLEAFLGKAGATFCRLFSSIISYIGVLLCAYIVVTNFGVNATAALASLGIIGFGLTFGAQELIKDMISGMFILFEGRFKVGDLIDIGGEWYWIKSIGVRTTVVESYGTVRVINNSNMTGIVNIQNASYTVNIDFLLDSKYKTEEIKALITAELPAIKAVLPPETSDLKWKGIQDLTGSGTLFRIGAYCPPMEQSDVCRAIRNELKRILDEHGIEIAKEAIAVHTESEGKTKGK